MKNFVSKRIAIISMPFAPADGPSIQLGILGACLRRAGFIVDDYYFNIKFFQCMKGKECHQIYNSTMPSLVSEWIFSPIPFTRKKNLLDMNAHKRLEEYAAIAGITMDKLFDIKEQIAPLFLDEILQNYDWGQYLALCFTLSYAQVNASFELAKRIKQRFPHIRTIFGGASSQVHEDSIKEFMRVYEFIDHFVLGDCEPVIAPLIQAIYEKRREISEKNIEEKSPYEITSELPGVYYRSAGGIKSTGGVSILKDINLSPIPDYDSFFSLYGNLDPSFRYNLRRYIPVEMARGCIWGQNKPCSFCAFYPGEKYRLKSPERIVEEIKIQVEKYKARSIYVVDAAITPCVIEKVFSKFPNIHKGLNVPFLEVRANLKEKHVMILKYAGVSLIQPGIECLNGGLLKKINKGVSLFSNLVLMKALRKYGISNSYNIILGIPDATKEEIENQLRVMKLIPHLDPPFPMPLSLVRFSDYVLNPQKYGLKDIRPDDFYRYIYPKEIDIEKVAFDFIAISERDLTSLNPIYQETIQYIAKWRRMWSSNIKPFLTVKQKGRGGEPSPTKSLKMVDWKSEKEENGLRRDTPHTSKSGPIVIMDGRKSPLKPILYEIDGLKAEIYQMCMHRPQTSKVIKEKLPPEFKLATIGEIQSVLEEFEDLGLMVSENGLFLSLAVE